MMLSAATFVGAKLGRQFTEPKPWNLFNVFKDTAPGTPIIFILTTGADPTSMLQRFAEKKGWIPGERLHMISLGQGQGPIAEGLITKGTKTGDWVCLQNCHLAKSWMLRLEMIVEGLSNGTTECHEDFRLFLTSMPATTFPVLVLQNGVKLTNEPPKGIKANINRTFYDMGEEQYDQCAKLHAWKKLLFGLAFFHATIQERRKFGPLGWNIRYEFNNSDIECSMMTLHMFLEEQETISFEALSYVIGEINYGGRVTDDLDRRCLLAILRQYMNNSVLDDSYRFSPSGKYYSPAEGHLEDVREYIKGLPTSEAPEVFGMHDNANIAFQINEAKILLERVLSMQPRVGGSEGGKTPDEVVLELAQNIFENLPSTLNVEDAGERTFATNEEGMMTSMAVVLSQETARFVRLQLRMHSSLIELQKAIKGLVVMSGELETMYNSLLNNQVPQVWESVGYPCLKPLASWLVDYHARIAFFRTWMEEAELKCYWVPGFFFPQGFLTGVLQTFARKYAIPIDTLNFGFDVLVETDGDKILEGPEDGVYVNGLYVDGGRWNAAGHHLDESEPGVMQSTMPIVQMLPMQKPLEDLFRPLRQDEYQTPLYKTSLRAGILSTTGQSTNFVLCVLLPLRPGTTPDFWVQQGVSLLCMLDT
jgi:dynein heavy chain